LARLLGDHLLFGEDAALLPATRAHTFRQKAQRTFAAELLSPFEAVEEMLQGDFSPEAIEEVGRHFSVSALTVETLLRNNDLIEREPFADAA
jgi:Zn-dependent peptidase ImmA (M78 family)